MDSGVKRLKQWIEESDNIVFFGGAGVSTESGIPDFRSVDGLYNQKWKYPPETILSASFFARDPEEYYRFHREKLVIENVQPNRAHKRLAELEAEGKLRAAPHPQLHAACQPNKEFGFQWQGSSRLCSNISEYLQTHWK